MSLKWTLQRCRLKAAALHLPTELPTSACQLACSAESRCGSFKNNKNRAHSYRYLFTVRLVFAAKSIIGCTPLCQWEKLNENHQHTNMFVLCNWDLL